MQLVDMNLRRMASHSACWGTAWIQSVRRFCCGTLHSIQPRISALPRLLEGFVLSLNELAIAFFTEECRLSTGSFPKSETAAVTM